MKYLKFNRIHGYRIIIINSVEPTLKYYLRMMKNPDNFLSRHIESVEKEIAIKFEHKQAWNDIVVKGPT